MYIHSVCLENLKLFKSLAFDFMRPDGGYAGWTVFVGGNSSGKSTLLKAMALALMGPDVGGRLLGATRGWIQEGERNALARVILTPDRDRDRYITLGRPSSQELPTAVKWRLDENTDQIPSFRSAGENGEKENSKIKSKVNMIKKSPEQGPWNPNSQGWFAVAYGPMRRLSGSSSESMRFAASKEAESRFVTLFREDAALSESEEWLRRMHARGLEAKDGKAEIDNVIAGVRALLEDGLLPQGMKIERITVDHVFIRDGHGVELPMSEISDGCRSVYATVLDIIHNLYDKYGANDMFDIDSNGHTVVKLPGVVIIDEVEAHLHPSWQRQIPVWLKQHFPAIQFLVSTHSPLIAQEADENGLFILPIQDDLDSSPRAATQEEYERIRSGSAHKTVLGVAFGLESTRTRWAESVLKSWRRLNAKAKDADVLSEGETKELDVLRQQVSLICNEKDE